MSEEARSPLRIVTFGDLDAGFWGAVWSGDDPGFAAGSLEHQITGHASIEGFADQDQWTANGGRIELRVTPAGAAVHCDTFDGFDQLCRAAGRIELAGATLAVDSLGRRALRAGPDLEHAQSVRDVSGWFAPDQGLALTSVRPASAKGHDRDLVAGAVLDAGDERPVADPRLSTTYRADGTPARAGLELWLSDDVEAEQYPRMAAGEAAGSAASSAGAALAVLAEPFRWHSRGSDGTGVYLLMRRR